MNLTVKLSIHALGANFSMADDGAFLARGQIPIADVPIFAARVEADPNFTTASYAGTLASPPAKFTADLPPEEAAALAAQWVEPLPQNQPSD